MKPINFVQSDVVTEVAPTLETQLPGLRELWQQTTGDPRICIAILDGPVDLAHPSLREAALAQINLDEVTDSVAAPFSDHGTHVTSIIFGSHGSPVKGIAPNCRGLIIPIFRRAADGSLQACSQERLAKAIRAAVRFGANVINISAGQFSSRGEARPELLAAIAACGEDVLIVSAAGNDGCDCLHVPGALPSVLAVGAMDAAGRPLAFSNWGAAYREQGVLAPGERILGAAGDGGVKPQSGTSFSTPIVSGVAGLLLSLQQKLGIVPSSKSIRNAILETTHGCDPQTETQCERVLAGRLSISGSVSVVTRGTSIMQHATNSPTSADARVQPAMGYAPANQPFVAAVEASACCGGGAGKSNQFVYAIGELRYDFPSVLRESSVQQSMDSLEAVSGHFPQARNSLDFLRHLFGFEEVRISAMKIGDIKRIEKIEDPKDSDEGSSQLKVTVSYFNKHKITAGDVGHQIGFNGVRVGNGELAPPSVLNSCNSMFIRRVEDLPENMQEIYVDTSRVDSGSVDVSMGEAHYYVPKFCRVTHEHRPHMYDASAVIWKLNRGQMEVYGIVPEGNFAEAAYGELAEFYMSQCGWTKAGLNYYYYEKSGRLLPWEFGWQPCFKTSTANPPDNSNAMDTNPLVQERSERVAMTGVLQGEVQLITGVRLPAIKPDMRGTSEWSQAAMLEILLDAVRNSSGVALSAKDEEVVGKKIRTLLERLDNSVRNPGLSPEHRALNHAATNLFGAIGEVAGELLASDQGADIRLAKNFELDDIVVKRSEIGYAGSDCWDVEISFFNPENTEAAVVVVAQTIDVNDTIPALTDKPRKFRRR